MRKRVDCGKMYKGERQLTFLNVLSSRRVTLASYKESSDIAAYDASDPRGVLHSFNFTWANGDPVAQPLRESGLHW